MLHYVSKSVPTVLVVDDDENIISAFRDFLKREGCRMVSASSADEALRRLEDTDIDLLITDVRLGYQSGVSMFLEAGAKHSDIPVIVITGYPESIREDEVKALGASFLLLKPLELEKLRSAVRSCLHPAGSEQRKS